MLLVCKKWTLRMGKETAAKRNHRWKVRLEKHCCMVGLLSPAVDGGPVGGQPDGDLRWGTRLKEALVLVK